MIGGYDGKVVAVLGLGKTGLSVIKALIMSNVREIVAIDDSDVRWDDMCADSAFVHAKACDILHFVKGRDALQRLQDLHVNTLIVSPGVPMQSAGVHPVISEARRLGIKITCDLDLFYDAVRHSQVAVQCIGITGSNGKSTTTALAEFLLQEVFRRRQVLRAVYAAGNIGNAVLDVIRGSAQCRPVCDDGSGHGVGKSRVLQAAPVYVLEISSFQLDAIDTMRLDVAVCINITADHLERYGSMRCYALSKSRIFEICRAGGTCVVSLDYPETAAIYKQLMQQNAVMVCKRSLVPFSVRTRLNGGISMLDNTLVIDDVCDMVHTECNMQQYLPVALHGWHNAENVISAIAACLSLGLGITIEEIVSVLPHFTGLRHRAQLVATKGRIRFINDSKGTNVASTQRALESFNNIYWIAGGKSKGEDLAPLANMFTNVRKAYLIGDTVHDLAVLCEKFGLQYAICVTLENALNKIKKDIDDVQDPVTVLLSPAHSSLDQWINFEERGDFFVTYVTKLWDV